ncbi:GNAT family N-acetyltransferase [Jannaschia pohangensis]|uniref:Predicted acetyltransferase n=1 Tax=Jannaschia pohangensis TaxID=390807 RepID=A0A1I3MNI9_9RHOB|nr:GNAT family N-acetyltransferase [Jannaschia pohangensis]SFI98226.1 Predicted acetyltransferase [Jannaschia pohangensis]
MADQTVELFAANDAQKPVIENLIQLYLYDMAAQSKFPLNAQGRYEYDFLDQFWEYPYLILVNGEIAGFCMVISHCPIRERTPCWFMAEFCILRPYQLKGAGRSALFAVLERHPGDWEISWGNDNKPATEFWQTVIPDITKKQTVSFDGAEWASVAFTV